MNSKMSRFGLLLLAALTLIFTLAVYPSLPALFPTHWNMHGQPDKWGDKSWAAFVTPGLLLFVAGLQWFLTASRDLSETDKDIRGYVCFVVGVLFGVIQLLGVRTALNPDMPSAPHLFTSALLAVLGALSNVLGKVPRNPFMGVRTPWTLASDAVWIATHRLAARLMTATACLGAVVVWFGVPPAFCWGAVIVSGLVAAAYSYPLYCRYEGGAK